MAYNLGMHMTILPRFVRVIAVCGAAAVALGCSAAADGARAALVVIRVSSAAIEPAIATAHAVALARCDTKADPQPCRVHVAEAHGAALRSAAHLSDAATQAGEALESLEQAAAEADAALQALRAAQ